MYKKKHIYGSGKLRYRLYAACLFGVMCLALACAGGVSIGAPAVYADGVPGGNISDPLVRAVDIAQPAIVRILTQIVGTLTVTFSNGQKVTFPQTPQNGVNGYPLLFSGTGSFISAHGDILTADHVVNPVQDDRQGLDQALQQTAAPDVATYINQHFNQQVTSDQVTQELANQQLPSTSQYQTPVSVAYLSTNFSGPLTATSINNVPANQFAQVDTIKAHSPFSAQDTAIIHVSGMDNMPMLQLGNSSAVQEQDQLRIIGFPGNGDVNLAPTDFLTSSINQVLVSSIKTSETGAPLIQVGGNVEQGDSGGPALDSNGNVVGIVSFGAAATVGSTSFLRPSNSATQLIQQAGIDTTASPFQKAWSQAFSDYAAQTGGHWHKAAQEFQQLSTQFPLFKGVTPYLQYAQQQAQSEKVTSPSGTNQPAPGQTSPVGGNNLLYLVGGSVVLVLVIILVVAVVGSRRRKPAGLVNAGVPPYNRGPGVGYPGPGGQGYGGSTPMQAPQPSGYPGQTPQTPNYPGQAPQAPGYSAPTPAYRPQPPQNPAQIPSLQSGTSYQPGAQGQQWPQPNLPVTPRPLPQPQPAGAGSAMSAFGAPQGSAPEPTVIARPAGSQPQWQTWPCGHTNRSDARFCGVCGDISPILPRNAP